MDAFLIPDNEFAPFYKGYVESASHLEIREGLKLEKERSFSFFESIPADKQLYRYDEGKWTPKEILLHITDAERVFALRAFWIARSNDAQLQGFDQDEFVQNSNANARDFESLLHEFEAVREASIQLFDSFMESDFLKTGKVNGAMVSVRAIGKIILGHALHHQRILKERYL